MVEGQDIDTLFGSTYHLLFVFFFLLLVPDWMGGFSLPKAIKEDQSVSTPIDEKSFALVVGGTRGIGLEFVNQLLDKGAKVCMTYRGSVPSDVKVDNEKLFAMQMDVSDYSSIKRAADEFRSKHGASLTHIIHNAGVYGPTKTSQSDLSKLTPEGMMEVFQVNTLGGLFVAQNFAPLLNPPAPNRPAVMAFLSSKMGSVNDNTSGGTYAYRASKSALNNVVKSLAIDLRPQNIAVVNLHPGWVRTDMTRQSGLIDPPECVKGLLKAVEATSMDKEPGRWVDYKADIVPW
ncbi:hypothetical protein AAMO2058_000452000 [Amorphochlora amoebiformis]